MSEAEMRSLFSDYKPGWQLVLLGTVEDGAMYVHESRAWRRLH
jgi:hypothetical protein